MRPLPDARVSAPLDWSEVPECDPADFTVLTMPARYQATGDPHANMDKAPASLDALLQLAARDEASGLKDAPWPPHFRKMAGEESRVMPSRAKPSPNKDKAAPSARKPRARMPLVTIANSLDKEAALAGLDRWKNHYPDVANHLQPNDVLVDSMRGRSSTWTRIRVNLHNVPELMRPTQKTPDPDDDPTRAWRTNLKRP